MDTSIDQTSLAGQPTSTEREGGLGSCRTSIRPAALWSAVQSQCSICHMIYEVRN